MAIVNGRTIRRVESSDWLGAPRYVYSNYRADTAAVTATDFFEDDSFNFAPRDLIWCELGDGFTTMRFISTTTVEVATD